MQLSNQLDQLDRYSKKTMSTNVVEAKSDRKAEVTCIQKT